MDCTRRQPQFPCSLCGPPYARRRARPWKKCRNGAMKMTAPFLTDYDLCRHALRRVGPQRQASFGHRRFQPLAAGPAVMRTSSRNILTICRKRSFCGSFMLEKRDVRLQHLFPHSGERSLHDPQPLEAAMPGQPVNQRRECQPAREAQEGKTTRQPWMLLLPSQRARGHGCGCVGCFLGSQALSCAPGESGSFVVRECANSYPNWPVNG